MHRILIFGFPVWPDTEYPARYQPILFSVTKGFEEKSVILLFKKLFIFIKLNIFIKASVLNNSSLLTMARYPAFLLTGYAARYLAAHRAGYHIKMPNYLDCLPLKLLLLQKGLNELQ